eukprot:2730724-Amphidinium_carterae.2
MDVPTNSPHRCCAPPLLHLDCCASPLLHNVTHAISGQASSTPMHATTSAASMDDDPSEKTKSHEEWSPPDFSAREDDMPDFDGDTETKDDAVEKHDDRKEDIADVAAVAKVAEDAEAKPSPAEEAAAAKAEVSVKADPENPEDLEGKGATDQAPPPVPEAGAEVPKPAGTKPDAEEEDEKPRKKTETERKFPYEDDEVVITGQTPPPASAPAQAAAPNVAQPTQQDDTGDTPANQPQTDTDRTDELVGKLHMGMVLNALLKPDTSRTELYDQIALPVGKIRKDVSRAKTAVEDIFTQKAEEIWIEIWKVQFDQPRNWEDRLHGLAE